jgi:hypothetical protein
MMITQKIVTRLAWGVSVILLSMYHANAQDSNIPADVASIVNMKLEAGQNKLAALGYEICASSFVGKKQDWYNEKTKHCVTVRFDKKEVVTEVTTNPDVSKCQQGLEASRKVWENYHDGQSPVNDAKINEERKKLSDQGFRVNYWVNDVSPGRSVEYWISDEKQTAMQIVWEIQGPKWVMTNKVDYSSHRQNPAPKR